jgi:hypothetical protein
VIGETLPDPWFRRHPRLTLSASALIGCVVAILLAEGAARVLFPEWAPAREERAKFWTYDGLLGWEHRPDERGRFNHQDFSVEVVTNSHGMRDDEYPLARTSKKRMLVLGDSFGWGFGVEHHERFSEVLESAYPDLEIINASVSGYGTDQQYLFLKESGVGFRPDIVLLLFYGNDYKDNLSDEACWYYKPFFVVESGSLALRNTPVPPATCRQWLDRFLHGRTYLGPRLDYGYQALKTRITSVLDGEAPAPREPNREGGPTRNNVTYRLMAAMNDVCKAAGARFILVSIPMGVEDRAMMRQMAERESIPYLQLDEFFESEGVRAVFPHDAHWNARGHAIAAAAIEGFLTGQGLLGPPKPER